MLPSRLHNVSRPCSVCGCCTFVDNVSLCLESLACIESLMLHSECHRCSPGRHSNHVGRHSPPLEYQIGSHCNHLLCGGTHSECVSWLNVRHCWPSRRVVAALLESVVRNETDL